MTTPLQLPPVQLPEPLVRDLRRMNPWWQDGQAPPLPATRYPAPSRRADPPPPRHAPRSRRRGPRPQADRQDHGPAPGYRGSAAAGGAAPQRLPRAGRPALGDRGGHGAYP